MAHKEAMKDPIDLSLDDEDIEIIAGWPAGKYPTRAPRSVQNSTARLAGEKGVDALRASTLQLVDALEREIDPDPHK